MPESVERCDALIDRLIDAWFCERPEYRLEFLIEFFLDTKDENRIF
jgi:hypothetical protein